MHMQQYAITNITLNNNKDDHLSQPNAISHCSLFVTFIMTYRAIFALAR